MIDLSHNFTPDQINEKPKTVAKVFFQAYGRQQVDYFVNEINTEEVKRKLAYVCTSYVLYGIHWYDITGEKLNEEMFNPPFQKDDSDKVK